MLQYTGGEILLDDVWDKERYKNGNTKNIKNYKTMLEYEKRM